MWCDHCTHVTVKFVKRCNAMKRSLSSKTVSQEAINTVFSKLHNPVPKQFSEATLANPAPSWQQGDSELVKAPSRVKRHPLETFSLSEYEKTTEYFRKLQKNVPKEFKTPKESSDWQAPN